MVKQKKNSAAKRLVLLDSHAIIHRAYHALPDFSSSKGEPTGALYGLITMLLKIVKDLKPDYIAAAFDLPGPTHRHEVYKEYKGTRAKIDDALVSQLIRAHSVFEAFGIPGYEAPGFEADDVIGAISQQLKKRPEVNVVVASGDLDTLQLVDGSRVQVYTLRKGLNDTVMYDEEEVVKRFNFPPSLIPDYKGLRGDTSDNIKGIAGIGEKTASELISKFGPIEEIYDVLRKNPETLQKAGIKARIIKLLEEGEKGARFSKMLATIRTDAFISYRLPDTPWRIEDHIERIYALCDELEFRSLKERLRPSLSLNVSEEKKPASEEKINPRLLKETSVALWLLHSDTVDPSLEDILDYTKQSDFSAARAAVFEELKKTGRLHDVYTNIEEPLISITDRMEQKGVLLDSVYLKKLAKEYKTELGKIEQRIFKAAGHEFNISSPRQLGAVLFDELKLSLPKQKKTPGGARTTREDELIKMSSLHPIIGDVLAYRELFKLLSTYIESLPGMVGSDGRLHARFRQAGTTTGRISSIDPNLQNISIQGENGRRVRMGFTAEKGNVLAALDYSQIELRIAAGLSGDKKLLQIFKEEGDVHTAVAAQVFKVPPSKVDYEMRRRAKVINFGILYGMGVNALRANLGEGVTREEAASFLSTYFKNFAGLALWIEKTKLEAARTGFTETIFGRRRYFSGFKSTLPNLRAQAERMAVNAPIQGTQSDIIKLAMVNADRMLQKNEWREKAALVLQVHDELVYEVREKDAENIAREIRETMEHSLSEGDLHDVPLLVEISIGKNWGEMKKVPRSK